MVKNNKITIFLIFLLLISVSISVYSLLKKGKAVPAVTLIIDGVTGKVVKKQYNEDGLFWNNYPIMIIQAEDKEINSGIITYDQNMVQRPLDSLLKGRSKLIFKFSMNYYTEEVDSTLKYIEKLKNNNILILTDADNIRYFKLQKSKIKTIKSKIFFIERSSMDFMISDRRLPFLFLISPDHKMSHIYVPRKEIPIVTSKYLEFMLKDSGFSKQNNNQ